MGEQGAVCQKGPPCPMPFEISRRFCCHGAGSRRNKVCSERGLVGVVQRASYDLLDLPRVEVDTRPEDGHCSVQRWSETIVARKRQRQRVVSRLCTATCYAISIQSSIQA
jgi:hypothetical protein